MSKKVNKQRKTRERGLNVKITEETKKSKSDKVRVNNNFDKKKASKKTTAKKTTEKKTPAKKAAEKKIIEKPVEKVEKIEEKPVETKVEEPKLTEVAEKTAAPASENSEAPVIKLPASFSRNEEVAISFSDLSWAKPEEKPEEKLEEKTKEKVEQKSETPEVTKEFTREEKPEIVETKVEEKPEVIETKTEEKPVEKIENIEKTENIQSTTPGLNLDDYQKNAPIILPTTPVNAQESAEKSSAKEMKEQEIQKAIKNAAKLPEGKNKRKRFRLNKISMPRFILAVSCMATAVFAVAYFVNLSAQDVSLKVAAMQSGIEASYPGYIPRGYSLSDVTSASGAVLMRFKSEEGEYVISEEASTWDSNALLNKFVKVEYNEDDYTVVKEQGLTLYMGTRWEAWVNGGTLYKLSVVSGSLTKKQLKTIATSL